MRDMKMYIFIILVGLGVAATGGLAAETETLSNITQINDDGFGTPANKYAFSIAVYKDSLYVGTLNIKRMPGMARFFSATSATRATEGAEIWRYDGDGTWTQVVKAGLGNYNNFGVRKMFAAGDCLYGVTANHDDGMEVWRTCDGDDWEIVADRGFGDSMNTSGRGLGSFKGYIYVGVENRKNGAQLWRSADGLEWEKVADKGVSDSGNFWLSDFAEFKGALYMGTLNIRGMQAYRTRDGVNLEKIFDSGLDKITNTAGMKLIVFNDRLYISTMDFLKGFDLYASEDGVNFQRVLQKGFTNKHYAYLWQMEEYNGRLYAGTYHHKATVLPTGRFALLSSADGKNWIVEDDSAFGNPWYYGVRTMAVYDGRLIIGTASAKYGCKIFMARGK